MIGFDRKKIICPPNVLPWTCMAIISTSIPVTIICRRCDVILTFRWRAITTPCIALVVRLINRTSDGARAFATAWQPVIACKAFMTTRRIWRHSGGARSRRWRWTPVSSCRLRRQMARRTGVIAVALWRHHVVSCGVTAVLIISWAPRAVTWSTLIIRVIIERRWTLKSVKQKVKQFILSRKNRSLNGKSRYNSGAVKIALYFKHLRAVRMLMN